MCAITMLVTGFSECLSVGELLRRYVLHNNEPMMVYSQKRCAVFGHRSRALRNWVA